jgi:hypothetical protein
MLGLTNSKSVADPKKKKERTPVALSLGTSVTSKYVVKPFFVLNDGSASYRQTSVLDAFRTIPPEKVMTEDEVKKRKWDQNEREVERAVKIQKAKEENPPVPKKKTVMMYKAPVPALHSVPLPGLRANAHLPYIVPTIRAEIFKTLNFPSEMQRNLMKTWIQGSEEWQKWRKESNTVGGSDIGEACGVGSYNPPIAFMWKLAGKKFSSRDENIFTIIGHLFESINVATFLAMMKSRFGIKDCKQNEIGTIYNLIHRWGTASLDGLLLGDGKFSFAQEIDEEGTKWAVPIPASGPGKNKTYEYNLDDAIVECKCHSTKEFEEPPASQIFQMTWQLMACMTQSDQNLNNKKIAFLNHLYIPFEKKDNTEGKEAFTIEKQRAWKQRTWVMEFHKPLADWIVKRMTDRETGFRAAYEEFVKDTTEVDGLVEKFPWIAQKDYDVFKDHPELMPVIHRLPDSFFRYSGEYECDASNKENREAFLDDVRLSFHEEGKSSKGYFTPWKKHAEDSSLKM